MPRFIRAKTPGATWFFTVNLQQRHGNDLLVRHINVLRACVAQERARRPFAILAWVVLPEHMHCLWTLPAEDADFARRWHVIKTAFSRRLPARQSPNSRRERDIWQRRYWEHLIRDEADYQRHFDYIHINPLKHGHVRRLIDWPYSSFHRAVRQGIHGLDWAGDGSAGAAGLGER